MPLILYSFYFLPNFDRKLSNLNILRSSQQAFTEVLDVEIGFNHSERPLYFFFLNSMIVDGVCSGRTLVERQAEHILVGHEHLVPRLVCWGDVVISSV